MILNISYKSKKNDRQIEDCIGRSFSFLERFKMGGIGCAKLQIVESSPDIHHIISANRNTAYCNIEMRLEGLLVGFNSTMRIYAWCIPYYRLNIYYNGGQLTIYGPANHIKLKPPFNGTVDKKFLKKVLVQKAQWRSDYP